MPPWPVWFRGRENVRRALASSWDPALEGYVGEFALRPVGANRQPAVASYTRMPGEATFRPFAISVVEIQDGFFTELTAFHDPALFPAFGLPAEISAGDR